MSVDIISNVFKHSRSELAARLVLLAIADYAYKDGVAWPSEETLSARCMLGERTVRRAITALQLLGELQVRTAQRGQRRVNVYRVTVGEVDPVDYDRLPFTPNRRFEATLP